MSNNNNNNEDFNNSYLSYKESLETKIEHNNLPIFDKRFKIYNQDQILLTTIDPEKIFPKGCYERFLVETIKRIDTSGFAKEERVDLVGRTEYNPKSIFNKG